MLEGNLPLALVDLVGWWYIRPAQGPYGGRLHRPTFQDKMSGSPRTPYRVCRGVPDEGTFASSLMSGRDPEETLAKAGSNGDKSPADALLLGVHVSKPSRGGGCNKISQPGFVH